MADVLTAVPFTAELLPHVQQFDCGDAPFERPLADWLRDDALEAIRRGALVWLFVNAAGDVVGYGALGASNWRYPDPSSRRVPVQTLIRVAVQRRFQGQPAGPAEARYSRQILDHLLAAAWDRVDTVSPLLGRLVHPDNVRAIRFYEKTGFRPFSHVYREPNSGVEYRSMIYELRPATEPPSAPPQP
jgi:GNAT superfamily N-acetyltransferase